MCRDTLMVLAIDTGLASSVHVAGALQTYRHIKQGGDVYKVLMPEFLGMTIQRRVVNMFFRGQKVYKNFGRNATQTIARWATAMMK